MRLKHHAIIELSGGTLNSNLRTVAIAVNKNGYVLKDLVEYVDELEKRVEKLEQLKEQKC